MVWPIDDVIRLGEILSDVAAGDPISFLLAMVGALIMGGSILVFGYFTVAGLVAPMFEG